MMKVIWMNNWVILVDIFYACCPFVPFQCLLTLPKDVIWFVYVSECHLAGFFFLEKKWKLALTLSVSLLLSWIFLFREIKQEGLSEPAGQVTMEQEGRSDSESALQQPDHQEADASDLCPEKVRRPRKRPVETVILKRGEGKTLLRGRSSWTIPELLSRCKWT